VSDLPSCAGVDQGVATFFGRIPDRYDTVESRRLMEIGDHLAVGGVNPRALPPAASGQDPLLCSRALAQYDRDEALLLEGQ
jgi:hypothetical protein